MYDIIKAHKETVERRREINAAGDRRFDRFRDSMGVRELQRASTARSQARRRLTQLEGDRRAANENPHVGGGRTWVKGFYREVRGRRIWVRGHYETRS